MNLGRPGVQCHIVAVFTLILAGAAVPGLPAGIAARITDSAGALSGYDLESADAVQFELGRSMREISGLAIDARGRLFAHNDERAIVSVIEPATGAIVKSFRVGRNGVLGDFEGITFAGSRLFLISSGGDMLEFGEGGDDESVVYAMTDAESGDLCREIEGLDYDAANNGLLLVCKVTKKRALRDRMVVLRYSLRTRRLDAEPVYSIPLDFLEPYGFKKDLHPSAVAIHPVANTLFIVAARENVIVEVDRSGTVIGAARLNRTSHRQAEGIAFARNGTMYIADEGSSDRATLTVYPFKADPVREQPPGRTYQ